jgi:predicted O-methyltransferase YrrM
MTQESWQKWDKIYTLGQHLMSQRNAEIKNYICTHFAQEDQDLLTVTKNAKSAEIPEIAVSSDIGKIIYLLAKLHRPKRILEVGTLAGYSTTWLSKAAPEAKIITLEYNPNFASVAKANFKELNLDHQIRIIEGDAKASMEKLIDEKTSPFDLIFLDAFNEEYPDLLPYILKLSSPGTMLLTDNLIPKEGQINFDEGRDLEAVKTYEYNAMLTRLPNVETVFIPTIVGKKGRTDALAVSIFK